MPLTPPRLAPDFAALLGRGVPVGLAVSGGGDSLALLLAVLDLGGQVTVASVNHGLRPEAADECALVARICADHGVPHRVLHWTGWDGIGNLQDQARRARYRLLADWARAVGVADVALGHTADDQAETVIMALARGAGVDGLAGMAATTIKHDIRFHRPLLDASRADLRRYLRAAGQVWCDDPGNGDTAYERIRIRQAAAALAGLGLTPQALGQVARRMADAAEALGRQQDASAASMLAQQGDMLITCDLAGLSAEQARRLVLAGMGWVNRALTPPRRDEQTRLVHQLRAHRPATLGGCRFSFDGPVLRIGREWAAVRDHITATNALWDRRWRLSGPHEAALHVAALGAGIDACPDWRLTGLPYATLQATPAVWRGEQLICAPLVQSGTGWIAQIVAE